MVHQGYINHVGLVLDASGSMAHLKDSVVKVADMQVQYLAQRSKEVDQETRATVYHFDDTVECLYYDKDVLRLPSTKDHYYRNKGRSTALIDATLKSIEDLRMTATLYGDHAFLLYVVTDGQENVSGNKSDKLRATFNTLPDNWTVAVFVPDQRGVHEAKQFGFHPGNIAVWNTSEQGIKEVGETIRRTTDAYMQARTQGIRSTRGLFMLDTQNLDKNAIKQTLTKMQPNEYNVFVVQGSEDIAGFVSRMTMRPYVSGSAFYELSKSETVQAGKQIAIMDRNRNVYRGREARSLLGLPDYEVKVAAADHPEYDIFVQSTSHNRKLVPGTRLVVFR